MKRIFELVFVIFLIWALSGCVSRSRDQLLGCGQNVVCQQISTLDKRLSGQGITVLWRSGSVKLLLPTKKFFAKKSSRFTDDAYELLDLISGLADCCQDEAVAITWYSGSSDGFVKALSRERARKIARYLWRSKIGSNFIYAGDKYNGLLARNSKISRSDYIVIEFTNCPYD